MRFRVTHRTSYVYGGVYDGADYGAVSRAVNEAHLLPRATPRQDVAAATLEVTPHPDVVREHGDYYGNRTHFFVVDTAFRRMDVTARRDVDVHAGPASGSVPDVSWDGAASAGFGDAGVAEFAMPSPLAPCLPEIGEYAAASFVPGRPVVEVAAELTSRIHSGFTYDPHFTDTTTPLADVIGHRRGVCQDFAHLAIACLRSHGVAARYVSGYIETDPPEAAGDLVGADASHAWFAVFVPGHGWVDFDPTNNVAAGEQHITIGWGRDFGDVSPLKGVIYFGGGERTLDVAVTVERLRE